MIALFTLVAMLASAPAQTTPAPDSGQGVPEIGRTKSKAPACAALQELVAPSFAAARRVDQQFAQSAPQFAAYAGAKDASTPLPTNIKHAGGGTDQPDSADFAVKPRGAEDLDSVNPDAYIARLDKALAGMKQDILAIAKALGDPRLTSDSPDRAVQSEREALLRLFLAQASRAATLQEFLDRERLNRIKADTTLTDNGAFWPAGVGGSASEKIAAQAEAALSSGHVPLLVGQPMLGGLAANDKQSVNDWTASIARIVHDNENLAAKTFLEIAQSCK
jgi:hypothetical protein